MAGIAVEQTDNRLKCTIRAENLFPSNASGPVSAFPRQSAAVRLRREPVGEAWCLASATHPADCPALPVPIT